MNDFFDDININTVLNALRIALEVRRQVLEWFEKRRKRKAQPDDDKQPSSE